MAQQISNFDFTIDCTKVYLWQYDQAEKLQTILKGTENFLSVAVTQFWENYLTDVFTIATANTFGLNTWGRTLGIARPQYTDENNAIVSVSDAMYRRMLIGAIYKYNMTGTVPEINYYLQYVFNSKLIYILDGLNMTMTLIYAKALTAEEFAVLTSPGFIPRPAGVGVNIPGVDKIFGFNGSELEPFDNGVFIY